MPDFETRIGIVVPHTAIRSPRAKALTELLERGILPYIRLIQCRQSSGEAAEDFVVVDMDVERGQLRANDIRHTEQIALVFDATHDNMPKAWSLRADFPQVPHLGLMPAGFPRSLCLYEESWDALKFRWTPAAFVERVREWLSQTSRGTLHGEDQPLEPLLLSHRFKVVIPPDLFTGATTAESLLACWGHEHKVLLTYRAGGKDKIAPSFMAFPFKCQPQIHGVIHHTPSNLDELHNFCLTAGLNLLDELKKCLQTLDRGGANLQANLILLIAFPKVRAKGIEIEDSDIWAFVTGSTIAEVGRHVGLWDLHKGKVGMLLAGNGTQMDATAVGIGVLAPIQDFSPAQAAAANCLSKVPQRAIVAVGNGALGSQVVMNMARAGFAQWTLVDDDELLPHNLARHAVVEPVGMPKAWIVAEQVNVLFRNPNAAKSIVVNVLSPEDHAILLTESLEKASAILDMSASVPVARHLACDVKSDARRISLFLNPTGGDLVLLAEDAARTIPLDFLEMQYYRAIESDSRLKGHLVDGPRRIRYAMSCRDVTSVIPQARVGMYAGTGAHAIQTALNDAVADIRIWRADPATLAVQAVQIRPSPVIIQQFGEWTLLTDEWLLNKIAGLRSGKLPNETGGVLIGSFDLQRRRVYVVDTIPSPPDSQEWPTLYIRGSQDLAGQLSDLTGATGQNLEYVGEWHSHPPKCPALPSTDDLQVFAWLTQLMETAGHPALMLIAGSRTDMRFFLGTMERGNG